MASLNCSALDVRKDFEAYAHELVTATSGDLRILGQCRRQVCNAIWGAENGDVSGIGMLIAYTLDHMLGLLFSISITALQGNRSPNVKYVLKRGIVAFHDCASFLAFSIEVALVVFLVRADFDISTDGMGGNTTVIAYAVAMLVLLPLVYTVVGLPGDDPDHAAPHTVDGVGHDRRSEHSRRLVLLVLCWALALYPFFSSVNAAFGPSKISNAAGAALSIAQLRIIEGVCFAGVDAITQREAFLMESFVILTYIPLSAALLGCILWSGIQRNHEGSALHRRLVVLEARIPITLKRRSTVAGLAAIPLLASGLLWSVLRTRQAQKQLAVELDSDSRDNDWTFGQVAAVTLFAPVLFECWSAFASIRAKQKQNSSGDQTMETERAGK